MQAADPLDPPLFIYLSDIFRHIPGHLTINWVCDNLPGSANGLIVPTTGDQMINLHGPPTAASASAMFMGKHNGNDIGGANQRTRGNNPAHSVAGGTNFFDT